MATRRLSTRLWQFLELLKQARDERCRQTRLRTLSRKE
jgi:hypothetical protein